MLNLHKKKPIREFVYSRDHINSTFVDLKKLVVTNGRTKEQIMDETVGKLIASIDYEKLHLVSKYCAKMSNRVIPSIPKLKETILSILIDVVENYLANGADATYVTEYFVANVSTYNNSTNISLSPRIDF